MHSLGGCLNPLGHWQLHASLSANTVRITCRSYSFDSPTASHWILVGMVKWLVLHILPRAPGMPRPFRLKASVANPVERMLFTYILMWLLFCCMHAVHACTAMDE